MGKTEVPWDQHEPRFSIRSALRKDRQHSGAEGIVQVVDSVWVRVPQLRRQGCSKKFWEKLLKYDLVKELLRKSPRPCRIGRHHLSLQCCTVLANAVGSPLSLTPKRGLRFWGLCPVPDSQRNTEFSRVLHTCLSISIKAVRVQIPVRTLEAVFRGISLLYPAHLSPWRFGPPNTYTTFFQKLSFSLGNHSPIIFNFVVYIGVRLSHHISPENQKIVLYWHWFRDRHVTKHKSVGGRDRLCPKSLENSFSPYELMCLWGLNWCLIHLLECKPEETWWPHLLWHVEI